MPAASATCCRLRHLLAMPAASATCWQCLPPPPPAYNAWRLGHLISHGMQTVHDSYVLRHALAHNGARHALRLEL